MKQDNSRHHFWTDWKRTTTPCNPFDNRNRKKWPDWLLLLLLKQSHSECPAGSTDHTLGHKVHCIRVDPWSKYSVTLCGDLQSVVAPRQRKASFTILFMMCLVLYPVRLGGGDWHRTSKKMMWGHPTVLPSGKPTFNLKLLQASLACTELWFAGDTTYMSERKTIWSFSCGHQLPSAIVRILD